MGNPSSQPEVSAQGLDVTSPEHSVAFAVVDDTVSLSIVSSIGFSILPREFPLKIEGLVAEADNYAATSTGKSISQKNYGALVT